MGPLYYNLVLGFGIYAWGAFLFEVVLSSAGGLNFFDLLTPLGTIAAFLIWFKKKVDWKVALLAGGPPSLLVKHLAAPIFGNSFIVDLTIVVFGLCIGGFFSLLLFKDRERNTSLVSMDKIEKGKFPYVLDSKGKFFFPTWSLNMHVQIIGDTGSGKSVSGIYPAIVQSFKNGLGSFIYDVKSNMAARIAYYATQTGRSSDLRYFDLFAPDRSLRYNPIFSGEADEIANRIIAGFYHDYKGEGFFKETAERFVTELVALLKAEVDVLTFADLYQVAFAEINTFSTISTLCSKYPDLPCSTYFKEKWLKMDPKDRAYNLSGLENKLARFANNKRWGALINTKQPQVTMDEVFRNKLIFLFGVSSMTMAEDAKALAIMALLDLKSQIQHRIVHIPEEPFDCFLDEFYNLAFVGFSDFVNKAREAKVRLFLAHQTIADLTMISKEFAEQVMSCTRNKIVLSSGHPETAEYFARLFGTKTVTEKVRSYDSREGVFGAQEAGYTEKTPDVFNFHPNLIKSFKAGDCICRVVVPPTANSVKEGVLTFNIHLMQIQDVPSSFDFSTVFPILNANKGGNDLSFPLKPNTFATSPFKRKSDQTEREEASVDADPMDNKVLSSEDDIINSIDNSLKKKKTARKGKTSEQPSEG